MGQRGKVCLLVNRYKFAVHIKLLCLLMSFLYNPSCHTPMVGFIVIDSFLCLSEQKDCTCTCVTRVCITGNSKQKWVPLAIETPKPPPRSFHRGNRDFNRRGRDRVGGRRYDGGRDRPHRPWRFERDNRQRGGPPRDHDERDKDGYPEGEAGYPDEFAGNNWQGMPDEKWQYPPPVAPGMTNRTALYLSFHMTRH